MWPTQQPTRPAPPALTSTAQLLGLSTSQLGQDLQSGSTLSSLASQAGVSNSDLISSITKDLAANAPQGAPVLSSTQLTQLATNIAHGTRPGGGSGASQGGGPPALTSTAQLLGLSTSQLSQDLQSGSTLSSLASQAGVSNSDLISSITKDLAANAPQGAPALSRTQLTQMATSIATGSAPSGTAWSSDSTSSSPSGSGVSAQSNLSSLASVLGTDPTTLLEQLTAGQDLSSVLSGSGETGYGTSVADSVNGGVAFDEYV
jgi:uncharacterized protein YidB (DUF937 family)